jgi:hypothetical protein
LQGIVQKVKTRTEIKSVVRLVAGKFETEFTELMEVEGFLP